MADRIIRRFVPLRLTLGRDRAEVRRFGLFWTPTLYVLDHTGTPRAESVGYLPPEETLAFLDFGEAQVLLRRGQLNEAAALFKGIAEERPGSGFAPDALYWAAIARYLASGNHADLDRYRAELRRRYPDSLAARKV